VSLESLARRRLGVGTSRIGYLEHGHGQSVVGAAIALSDEIGGRGKPGSALTSRGKGLIKSITIKNEQLQRVAEVVCGQSGLGRNNLTAKELKLPSHLISEVFKAARISVYPEYPSSGDQGGTTRKRCAPLVGRGEGLLS